MKDLFRSILQTITVILCVVAVSVLLVLPVSYVRVKIINGEHKTSYTALQYLFAQDIIDSEIARKLAGEEK